MMGDVISDHAAVRWLERHDGKDLSEIRSRDNVFTDSDILTAWWNQTGETPRSIRDRMWSDTLRTAIGTGAAAVISGRVRLVIVSGRVTTVRLVAWDYQRMNRSMALREHRYVERRRHATAA